METSSLQGSSERHDRVLRKEYGEVKESRELSKKMIELKSEQFLRVGSLCIC